MYISENSRLISLYEDSYEKLNMLETILKLTKESCNNRDEFPDNNYFDYSSKISVERNNYINMMKLALHYINEIKRNNELMECDIYGYSNIPTIAADR